MNALTSIKGKTYEQIKGAHIQEYQQYFNTFSIQFSKSKIRDVKVSPSGGDLEGALPTDERIEQFAT